MTRNKMCDLNDHLFAELERLGDEDLKGEALTEEIERAKAISTVAKSVIANGSLVLRAAEFADSRIDADANLPKMLEG